MSLKLIKLGLLVMHLLLFLVSCGGILVHGHRPPCADLCSHVCGQERSELRGEKGRDDARQGRSLNLNVTRNQYQTKPSSLCSILVHFTCYKTTALSTPNIVHYASNCKTQTGKATGKLCGS